MRIRSRFATGVVAVAALGLTGVVGTAAASQKPLSEVPDIVRAAHQPTVRPIAQPDAGTRTVTLLSGDRVVVTAGKAGNVTPGAGRDRVRFVRRTAGNDTYVIPSDAVDAVARGVLDQQLFNVTALATTRSTGGDVPLIVRYAAGRGGEQARRTLQAAGATERQPVRVLNARAVTVDRARRSGFWKRLVTAHGDTISGVRKVWLDGTAHPVLDHSVPQIGAPTAWRAGYTGKNVKVAVLDGGLDPTHPDLKGRVVAAKSFLDDDTSTVDVDGHGTHVASTIAGSGAASGGRYRGVAPDTDLLIGRVCGASDCSFSSILAGMQWAVDNGARIVNMSLGGPDTAGDDPLEEAVNTLTAKSGTLFVVAAGNDGAARTVGSPATADAALAVAAVDRHDVLAPFSSRGPRIGDSAVKPDLAAPGVGIVAARAKNTLEREAVNADYAALSGTSMATPHVTGAAALLAQQHPDWTAAQLKGALVGTAAPLQADAYAVGSGRVDVAHAITATTYATPASLSFGLARWPHPKSELQTRTVTLHNTGTTDATFNLSVTAKDPTGAPAAAGMFTLAASRVIVPAHGSTAITATAHTGLTGPDGIYTGLLTAARTDGKAQMHIAMGVEREVESYDVTITAKNRTGARTNPYVLLYPLPGVRGEQLADFTDGTAHLRLPAGKWTAIAATMETDGAQTIATVPNLNITRTTTIAFDSRRGKPIDVSVPDKTARLARSFAGITLGHRTYGSTTSIDGPDATTMTHTSGLYAVPTPRTDAPDLVYFAESQWAKPDGASFTNSPYTYHVLLPTSGGIPATLRHQVGRAELATVTSHIAANTPTATVQSIAEPYVGHRYGGGFWAVIVNHVPGTRTDYFTTGNGTVAWKQNLVFNTGETQYASPRTFRGGRRYTVQWNRPAFGPSLPPLPAGDWPLAARIANTLDAGLPLFSDSVTDHYGYAPLTSGSAHLDRNGIRVYDGDNPQRIRTELSPDDATYTLRVDATRAGSTSRVSAAWTFRTAPNRTDAATALPLSTIRIALRTINGYASPHPATVDVTAQSQSPGSGGHVRTITMDVSTDDGKTWTPASLHPTQPGRWTATIDNPSTNGAWISLRSSLTRADDGTTTQTLLHAYQTR